MALKTNAEMVQTLQEAIQEVAIKGQSYSIGEGPESKTYTRANLRELKDLLVFYQGQLRAETRGSQTGMTYVTFYG